MRDTTIGARNERRDSFCPSCERTRSDAISLNVLLADGASDFRRCCADSLRRQGWHVLESPDGQDALVKALTTRLSIVITDVHLDFIDGNTLCDILRHDRTSANLPILIQTGAPDAARLPHATRAAVDGVVIKPGPPTVILEAIRRLLHERAPILPRPSGEKSSGCAPARDDGSVFTSSPSVAPPLFDCPICRRVLIYRRTCLRRVSRDRIERWDDFDCGSCGQFQYRWRTRKLRHLTNRLRFQSAS